MRSLAQIVSQREKGEYKYTLKFLQCSERYFYQFNFSPSFFISCHELEGTALFLVTFYSGVHCLELQH
jgi:hypothetical protein